MTIFLFALVSVLILVGGQASLKYGLIRSGGISGESMLVLSTWVKVMSEPYVITGFYGVASALWLRVLSELELSLAYPIVSLSYAFSLIAGKWLFHDDLNPTRITGVVLIVLGAFVVSRS
jgi:multidrug transporter EmrE-like cation transporter